MPGALWSATYGRLFAALYELGLRRTEDAGLRDERHRLLARAAGRTLELGAGTGLNLPHYPSAVSELVLTEPSPHMAARLRGHVVEAPAERLPFEDASFDTAVSTLVLCTVPDPDAALAEVARVLRPGGLFLFLEHVRSEEPRLARWQDRVTPLTTYLFCGCHPNRTTLATIERSPLEVEEADHGTLPRAPFFARPLVVGVARKP